MNKQNIEKMVNAIIEIHQSNEDKGNIIKVAGDCISGEPTALNMNAKKLITGKPLPEAR